MDCLIDYIGLSGCGATNPASGLFVNSLPGISLKSIDSLADSEQVNYVGVWNDVQTRAIKRLELYLLSEISKKVKVKSSKFQTTTKYEHSQNNVNLTQFASIKLKADCDSSLMYHYIDKLVVHPVFQDNYVVVISDLDTGEQLYTNQWAMVDNSDPFVLTISKRFYRRNLIINWYGANQQYTSTTVSNIYHDCGSIEWGTTNSVTGVFTAGTQGYGVNLVGYSIGCDLTNLACTNRSLLSLPLWYLLGSELMMERTVSTRVNMWTIDRKQAEELKAYYDAESEKALKLVYNGIQMSNCDCCIDCDPPIAIREARL